MGYLEVKMLHFYDFECFLHDWLVVIINPITKTETVIVNDVAKLRSYYNQYKNEVWIGYNSREYDQYILKGILCGFNPKDINDHIIVGKKKGYTYSKLFYKVPVNNYDVMPQPPVGLKTLEAFMGKSIVETSVPFDIDRKLTESELEEVIKYCRYDVEATIEVFLRKKEEFDASMGLIKLFGLPLSDISKTKAQLVAKICGGKSLKVQPDPFSFPLVPCLKHIRKYKEVVDWYRNPVNHDYDKSLTVDVAGVPHTFAWGGLHAGEKFTGEGNFLLCDVTAYYPSIQQEYEFGKEVMSNWENFLKIHGENLRLKALGDKKARQPYKIGDNAISGQLKQTFSSMYYPVANNAVTVNGQLMLLLLIEMVEPYATLRQSNTDGIMLQVDDSACEREVRRCVIEWETLTGMGMEIEKFTKIVQADVNNYLAVSESGKIKRKGSCVKALSDLDYDLPIVNKALVDYILYDVPVERTINKCDNLIEFQKVVKVSSKYAFAMHNNKKLTEKTFRVFASSNPNDTYIGKCKSEGATNEKFANTPERCFIENGDIANAKCTDYPLDKQWYVDLSVKRLSEKFGVM